MSEAPDYVVISRRTLDGGMVEVVASIAPAKHVRVLLRPPHTTEADADALIRAQLARGRFTSPPPQPPRVA